MATSSRTSSRATRLLEHHRLRGRSYPAPRYWERFFQMLEEEAERRGKTPPPPPLFHGLEQPLTHDDQMARLDEQVIWADRNNLLHRVQMFFDAMPPFTPRGCVAQAWSVSELLRSWVKTATPQQRQEAERQHASVE